MLSVGVLPGCNILVEREVGDYPIIYLMGKVAIGKDGDSFRVSLENIEKKDAGQSDDEPDRKVLVKQIQMSSPLSSSRC